MTLVNPQDDPEARIRELEQPLSDVARTSELGQASTYGYVPPPSGAYPPPTAPLPGDIVFSSAAPPPPRPSRAKVVVPVVIAVAAFAIAGVVTYFLADQASVPGFDGGGATLANRPPDVGQTVPPTWGVAVPGSSVDTPPPGTTTSIAGFSENKTVACDGNVVTISGFENTVVLVGSCASVSVSGKDNVVTVDESTTIGVSGFDNRIVFHAGDPEITNSGFGNTVERG